MFDLPKDLTSIHDLKSNEMSDIIRYLSLLISDYVAISKMDFENITEIDIGIGRLIIELCQADDGDSFIYKFAPSDELMNDMKIMYKNNFHSTFTEDLNVKIHKKLKSVYKGLL